jgi:hypothetical protein
MPLWTPRVRRKDEGLASGLHRGQWTRGDPTSTSQAGYKAAADYFTTRCGLLLIAGGHPYKQRHGRKFRQYLQARLRRPHGSGRCKDGDGADGRGPRAFQRSPSALGAEAEITQGVQAATCCPTMFCSSRAGATLRVDRVLKYGGKIRRV